MKQYFLWAVVVILSVQGYSPSLAQPDYLPYPTQISWSPNGTYIAVSGYELMQVFHVDSGVMVLDVALDEREVRAHDWSEDSARLAYVDGNALRVWDVENGQLLFETDVASRNLGTIVGMDWSDNGKTIATVNVSVQNAVFIWDAQTYEVVKVINIAGADRIALSPDGRHIAIAYAGYGSSIINLDMETEMSFQLDSAITAAYTWNSNGS